MVGFSFKATQQFQQASVFDPDKAAYVSYDYNDASRQANFSFDWIRRLPNRPWDYAWLVEKHGSGFPFDLLDVPDVRARFPMQVLSRQPFPVIRPLIVKYPGLPWPLDTIATPPDIEQCFKETPDARKGFWNLRWPSGSFTWETILAHPSLQWDRAVLSDRRDIREDCLTTPSNFDLRLLALNPTVQMAWIFRRADWPWPKEILAGRADVDIDTIARVVKCGGLLDNGFWFRLSKNVQFNTSQFLETIAHADAPDETCQDPLGGSGSFRWFWNYHALSTNKCVTDELFSLLPKETYPWCVNPDGTLDRTGTAGGGPVVRPCNCPAGFGHTRRCMHDNGAPRYQSDD